jgi:hypothetical protein
MAMIEFVQNYEDLSTDKGFQFKFHCDKCGNGFMSHYQISTLGMAGSALRAAGDIFGGFLGSAGNSAYEIQRAVGGKAHDEALETAVKEGKQHFHQCARCGHWVCPDVCWNGKANQCVSCAPDFDREFTSAQAEAKVSAARSQLNEKAQQTNYVGNVDMSANAYAPAAGVPHQASTQGQALAAGAHCTACGAGMGTAKFCPECGTARLVTSGCPSCHAPVPPGVKFCGECGTKVI